jgi:hypothetical protein
MEPQDTTDKFSMGGAYFDLSETNGRFTASFSQETGGNTAGYAGYSLVGLQLTGSDSGSHSAGATVYRSATYTTKTSVPVPAGDYIVVGSSAVLTQDAGAVARVRMFDGTTQYGEMFDIYEQDISNWTPYWHVFRKTTTGTTTFSLQARSDGSNDIEVKQASVIVLDTSQFSNVYYAERTSSFTTDSSTYVNAMSASFTIANPSNKHLLLAAAMLSGSRSAVSSFNCKLRNTTEAVDYIPEQVREPNAVDELYPTVVCRTVTFSGASNTIAWQLLEELNATALLTNMTIAILDLGTTGIPTTTTTTTTSTTTTTTTAAPTTTTSTTTTTTTNNLQAISVRLSTDITLCGVSPVIRYVDGGVLSGMAKILYLANLTTPVTGFNYVVESTGGIIYEIDPGDGGIGNDSGASC